MPMTDGALICIEFERLKRLSVSAQQRRWIAIRKDDRHDVQVASEIMMTVSDLMFDHALKCVICNAERGKL
jgi:hypothetical protein